MTRNSCPAFWHNYTARAHVDILSPHTPVAGACINVANRAFYYTCRGARGMKMRERAYSVCVDAAYQLRG